MTEQQIMAWVKTHKKALVASIIGDAKPQKAPIAIIMAGIPGAGKTEFLAHIVTTFTDTVVIDLDYIASKIDGYKPQNYYAYRKTATIILSATLDKVLKNKINFALDGTFSHKNGHKNIERALRRGFITWLFFIVQDPKLAWIVTQARRQETGRPIERDGFVEACHNVVPNIQGTLRAFKKNEHFQAGLVMKEDMQSAKYIDDPNNIDKILEDIYTIYKEII